MNLIWTGFAYAPLCLALYLVATYLSIYLKDGARKDRIMTGIVALIYGFGIVGCTFIAAGCINMAQNAS